MMIPRAAWPAALMACLIIGACGGSSSDEPGTGATGGPAGTPEGGSGGSDSMTLTELGDCSPLDDTCPEGTYCQLREGRTDCVEAGSTARDELCEETDTCQRGSICLSAGEFSGKLCQQPCPLDEEPWTVCDIGRHTCFVAVDDEDNELPFGVCRY